jgi:hypothetical protein
MKINELLVENEQLDELNLKGLGTGLGKAIGGAAGGVVQGAKNIWSGMKQGYAGAQQALSPDDSAGGAGAPTAGTAPAAAPAASTGGAAGGTTPAQTGGAGEVAATDLLARAKQGTAQDPAAQQQAAPAQQPAAQTPAPAASPAGGESPAADQQSKIGVGQINKIIPTLRTRDLNSVKKNVDATLAKKQKQPAAPAAAPAQAPAAAPNQAEIDADRERLMGPNNGGANESRVIKFRSKFLGMDI